MHGVPGRVVFGLRAFNALVWLGFGLLAKVLDGVPRHRAIVERVVGAEFAGQVTLLVGAVEVGLALWIISRQFPRLCAGAQTALLVSMNVMELWKARDLLLSPWAMIAANIVFLSVAWLVALATPPKTQ
jgi:predicted phage tail protein